MVNRLIQPFFAFVDATGAPRENYRLFFYSANTATKLNTYSATDLTLNANPLTLNSLGQCPTDVFGQNLAYDIVLALPGSNDPPTGSEVATYVDASTSDFTARAKLTGYNGNPNGFVAGTAATGSTAADTIYDYTNGIFYVCTTTGVAAVAVWTGINSSTAVSVVPEPQGRLTPSSVDSVINSDVSAATAIYYATYVGNLCPIYNGSIFNPTVFTQQALTLVASHLASQIYDVFSFSDSGVFTIGTGPAWSVSTAGSGSRGTGAGTTQLTLINGLRVNAVQITARNGSTTYTVAANRGTYLGSIFMDGTNGQISCLPNYGQNRKFGIWNAYNRVPITLRAGDGTSSWNYGTSTVRPANNSTSNKLTTFCGLAEEVVSLKVMQAVELVLAGAASGEINIGIGLNATNGFTGMIGGAAFSAASSNFSIGPLSIEGSHCILPFGGINNVTHCESSPAATNSTNTFFGTESHMVLSATYRG